MNIGRRLLSGAALLLVAAVLVFAYRLNIGRAEAESSEAATRTHTIAVFLSSRDDGCFTSARAQAIQYFIERRLAEINAAGDNRGRKFRAVFYDNMGRDDLSVSQMEEALELPDLVGIVGPSGSNRAKLVFDALGKKIAASNVPVLSSITVNEIFEPYANVFTMRPSQDDERMPVLTRFLADRGFIRPAFIGWSENVSSLSFDDALKRQTGAPELVASEYLALKRRQLEPGAGSRAAKAVIEATADVVLIALPSDAREQFLKEATAAGLTVPIVFLWGNEDSLQEGAAATYPNDLFLMSWDSMPDISRNRMREAMARMPNDVWTFGDVKNNDSPGWKTGACKSEDLRPPPSSSLEPDNLVNLTRAMQYADMAGLIADLVRSTPNDLSEEVQKSYRVERLKTVYAAGSGNYRGAFENWSFRPQSRSAARLPAVLVRPRGTTTVQLDAQQYTRLRNDILRPIQTLYMDLDLVRLFRVDDEEKSFFAEFYVAMRSDADISPSDIAFSNAFIDTNRSGEQLTITEIHDGDGSDTYPEGLRIAKVTGKFMMTPDLSAYPFDTQLFTIQLRPRDGKKAFLVQPPPESLRDRQSDTDGWLLVSQYAAFDEDVIPMTDARKRERSVVPFYTANFSWIMKRETTDYFLRVVVPLIFILIVAYLSIFIPREHFEAIVTIQVTALLSAVALYLSIPQVGSDTATVSDRIFLFDYLAVSLMIIISILRVNASVRSVRALDWTLSLLHITGIPLLCAAMALYVLSMERGETWSLTFAIPGLV